MNEIWNRAISSSAIPGKIYTIRIGTDGPSFLAWFSHDRIWRRVDPDSDGDGASELGPRVPDLNRIYFLVNS